jgi:tetratricopeptide (TPR) repeat protein/tRNA A-37 threonylcarbamoyl transferase component Bud32
MSNFKPIRFGKYLILDKIATGGMAELFRAKITSVEGFEKLVAIKKILPNLTQDSNLVDMFIDEAKLAAMLTHQNIVQIYDLGSMEGAYFIAMEYIHGKDLRVVSNKSKEKGLPLPLEYAIYITSRICSGLDYSHNLKDFQGNPLKLIHRDISPQNILVTYEGDVKIVDFGIAKAARKTADTREGLIKGKVAYMSPEQAAGKTIDHRSDIFSTGILLYEMITGVRMFEGDDVKILDKVRKADFQKAETIVSDLPAEVSDILRQALAKAPSRRYKSCVAMLAHLEDCLSSFTVRPRAEGLSHYMKALFAEEIAAEAAALLKIEAEVFSLKEEGATDGKTKTLHILEHIEPVPTTKTTPAPSTHRLWLGTWAVAMVAAAIFLAVLFKEKRVPTVSDDTVVTSVKTAKIPTPRAVAPAPSSTETAKEPAPPEPSQREEAMEALKQERFATAAALFEKALTDEPGDKSKIAPPYAQTLVGESISILESNPKQAESLLKKAIELDPTNAEAFYNLGKLYTSKKEYAKAIQAYDKAIDLNPRSPDAFFNLGFLYYGKKDYPKAEALFLKVTELQPTYLDEAYFNLAVVQNLQGKKEESIGNLERALEVNPNNDKARKYLLYLRRTSKNAKETDHLENKIFSSARTGTPLDHCRLRNSGQVHGADKQKTSFLG